MTAGPFQPHIGLIVEGPGDKVAVPLLLRLRLHGMEVYDDLLGKPISTNGRSNMTKPGGIEGFVAVATARPGCRSVLVVADSDDDRACALGPELLKRSGSQTNLPVVVALAERTYEDWLHASMESLRLGDSVAMYDEENSRGIVAIRQAMAPAKYVKTVHQPRFTASMNLSLAESRSPSLARFLRLFETLVPTVNP